MRTIIFSRINKLPVSLVFLFFLIPLSGFSITIYVSVLGNDANPGTINQPLASLKAARDKARLLRKSQFLKEPVIIEIAAGIYNLAEPLELTEEDSGTGISPLIFRGSKDNMPVLSGGVLLSSFQKVSDRLWKIELKNWPGLGGSFEQLFVNGKRAIRARTPNFDDPLYTTGRISETITDTLKKEENRPMAEQKIYLNAGQYKLLNSIDEQELQHALIVVHHAWDWTRKYITRFSREDSGIVITGTAMAPWNRLDNSSQFRLENAKAFLDAPGEWYLDKTGVLYYVPREGEFPGQSQAIVPLLDHLLVIKGNSHAKAKNIRFENLAFEFSRYLMPETGNQPDQQASRTDAAITVDDAEGIVFSKVEISHTGTNGIWFRDNCSQSSLTESYLHDLGIGAVKIGGLEIPTDNLLTRKITIDNNILRSGGFEFPTGAGISIFHAADNAVTHNDISDFIYSGVCIGWIWGYAFSPAVNNRIEFNHIHHLGWNQLSDMGGVYSLGSGKGTIIRNNLIHDIYSYGYGGWGLYTDEGSSGVLMENNLVYSCKNAGFHQHYGKDNILRNNIFAGNIHSQLQFTRPEKHRSLLIVRNIIYSDSSAFFQSMGENSWMKAITTIDSNIYWNIKNPNPVFHGMSLTAWQHAGKDKHSIIADPLFVDAGKKDFRFKNLSAVRKIGFVPFDYKKAGVYGSAGWLKLARLDAGRVALFDQIVKKCEMHPVLE